MSLLPNRRLLLLAAILVFITLAALNVNRITALFGVNADVGPGGQVAGQVPEGFEVEVFARDLAGPRFMAVGPDGTLFVAEQGGGRVSALPDRDGDGVADTRITVAEGLTGPSSLTFISGTNTLLVGEHTQLSQHTIGADYKSTESKVLVPNLPNDGFHRTKTVLQGPDGRLYVSMGSSCNVCREGDERRAAVTVYNLDGSSEQVWARGLRNAVGLALNPWSGEIWASNNGRDLMGDDTPPETIYALAGGKDYGWPRCHAGDIVDPEFGSPGACEGVESPVVEMQAHMAPLGLTFYEEVGFPAPYNNSLYVALHGSWNRSEKVGYKVMRVPLNEGRVAGEPQDFLTGFLSPDGSVSGRPAGVTVAADSSLMVSDDKGGFIYRVSWTGSGQQP